MKRWLFSVFSVAASLPATSARPLGAAVTTRTEQATFALG